MPDNLVIIRAGQTGADRIALDWAIRNGIPHAGWCPKGRRALEGPLDLKYNLKETSSAEWLERTEGNLRNSDATVVFTMADKASGGSKKTITLRQNSTRNRVFTCIQLYKWDRVHQNCDLLSSSSAPVGGILLVSGPKKSQASNHGFSKH